MPKKDSVLVKLVDDNARLVMRAKELEAQILDGKYASAATYDQLSGQFYRYKINTIRMTRRAWATRRRIAALEAELAKAKACPNDCDAMRAIQQHCGRLWEALLKIVDTPGWDAERVARKALEGEVSE